ncbi:hypothetical protein BLS_008043 [Venturia inaequalis]|uniref:Uncharacterized protein n=1 Tax=Venturia inaequalis TaxID=5025 RepID=A0A8H3YLE3_VENIN|nr:hypothetical protein BLS_008043 [Venturia inaequalis]KAE9988790.1 hypothetical protein EG328_007394 [Venturia inaequalis]KAE9993402.1 hypothetical protein EG327_005173 [Venturia inaequalis]
MHGLKQLLILALAGSGLACQCTAYGQKDGQVDIKATQTLYSVKDPAILLSTPSVLILLGFTLPFRCSGPLVEMIKLGVVKMEREEMVQEELSLSLTSVVCNRE